MQVVNIVETISLAHTDIVRKFAQLFEPAVQFSMSLSWTLWQYTKICLEGFHQLLNGVITESHLVTKCFDDAALILVKFLRTALLCGAL